MKKQTVAKLLKWIDPSLDLSDYEPILIQDKHNGSKIKGYILKRGRKMIFPHAPLHFIIHDERG